ncbi:MAG: bifunctional diaminohydroxyphosphoribosylaminopyrimidine deaminase/5-amino-6-(5-phosphoribosylamino)uracil reductase RibD, partial [Polaribacter sp.]
MQIAKNGLGTTRPNPSVGAVIVHQNKIIGEGFTSPFGGNHAEVNAINAVKKKELLKEATMYVTLEPCAHFGKTPPCADLIVKNKLNKVVIGCVDSNSLVAGKGITHLQKAGITVLIGVLEDECRAHHKRFFMVQEKKRPYIILKWAETSDGFIAPKIRKKIAPVWITNSYSQQLVHKWRSQEHAILVGTNTVVKDNPSLNVRSWFGKNPVRIILDKNLRIPKNSTVFDGNVKTIIITDIGEDRKKKKEKRTKNKELRTESYSEQREAICFEGINFSENI